MFLYDDTYVTDQCLRGEEHGPGHSLDSGRLYLIRLRNFKGR